MEQSITEIVKHLVLQLAVILLAAKIGGEICERFLHQPSVLGELVMGMAIGPFALGSIDLPGLGAIFPRIAESAGSYIPVSTELYAIGQLGAIILLFVAGLETDLRQFLRYGGAAFLIAVGGVVVPFFLGAYLSVVFGVAGSLGDPVALFTGAIMTATSVGITARVLSDMKRLDAPEGVIVLAAAVIDDVLGILVLAIVVSLGVSGTVSAGEIAAIGGKAVGFWLGLTAGGILLSKVISKFITAFEVEGARVGLGLALAFFCGYLAESMGLAMIIGAYSIGLALSSTELGHKLREPMSAVYHAVVPVFFVVMGMLVNFEAIGPVLLFGTVLSVAAILGKVLGCGLPALAIGFNVVGATRIGIGMLPRGEVALIVAGVGLTSGIVGSDVFGVAIMMTIVTTLLAPILLQPAFKRGGWGIRNESAPQ